MLASRLILNGGADVLAEVADVAARLGRLGGLGPGRTYRLRLAADEITTNIACHGYRGEPGAIDVTGGVDAGRVWLRIEDDAPPFDPTEHRVDAGTVRDVGGLGLRLARTVVDELGYERVHGRNSTVLVLRNDGGTDDRHHSGSRR